MQISTIYWPQSSPTDSAGFSSILSSTLEVISKSAPQSGQVTISPTTESFGTFISAPQSLHSMFKFVLTPRFSTLPYLLWHLPLPSVIPIVRQSPLLEPDRTRKTHRSLKHHSYKGNNRILYPSHVNFRYAFLI